MRVVSAAAVPITGTARITPALADRLGIPTILATGKVQADHASQEIAMRLRLAPKARSRLSRLARATLTLQVSQAGRTSTRLLPLR